MKPKITLLNDGAVINGFISNEWMKGNQFRVTILSCWIDFLNKQLTHNTKG